MTQEKNGNNLKPKDISVNRLKKDISIVEYAISKGYSVFKEGREIFSMKEHDSCKIYPTNTFYRFSSGAGGSIIDFVKEFEGLNTKEAISVLQEYYIENNVTYSSDNKRAVKQKNIQKSYSSLIIPKRYKDDKAIISYLTKLRKIKYEIVKDYLKRGIIYQDAQKNIVFQGKLEDSVLYIGKRSIFANFKQECKGSVSECGVFYQGKQKDTLVLTESVIDQMSYREIFDFHGEHCYLSVNGIKKAINCLNFHLLKRDCNQEIKNVMIAFDHDEWGEKEAVNVKNWLNENYPNIHVEIALPKNKDFNDDLVKQKASDYYNFLEKDIDKLEFNYISTNEEEIMSEVYAYELDYYENDLEI